MPSLAAIRSTGDPADGRDAPPTRSRPSRHASVVAFLPASEREASGRFAAELAERHERLGVWDARALLVVPAELERAMDGALGGMRHAIRVVVDTEGAVRSEWGVKPAEAALFIADRWGQVYHAETGAAVRDLSTGDEIEEWLKYLATQCAECGVPDEPGHGEWSSA